MQSRAHNLLEARKLHRRAAGPILPDAFAFDTDLKMPPCFTLTNVQKTYGPTNDDSVRPALSIDNLEIASGQTTAILGYSGSGKSTLLNVLSLLDQTDDNGGDITYRDQSYRSIRHNERAQNRLRGNEYGFVFQDNHLLEHFSAARNVAMGLAIKGVPLSECDRRAKVFLAEVGIESKAKSLPSELSGGEKQRVAVMRAIAHEPQVVFADEPTGNLDWDTGLAVMERLARWQKESGHTLIIVSHNIHQVIDFSDRFVMLKDGEIIFKGVHQSHAEEKLQDEVVVETADRLTDVLRIHSKVHPLESTAP
ncbi:MAG: ABC transporter ATP-binding protein [Planctomycetota bacterium]|nr:ABC transporter ATP-binding protein [Planctomycetota bacterium]MDA1142524.1 ABC transporter ATP-binding protein [Planctomycetota bacterium]